MYGLTDFLHVGESIPRPSTLTDTNDALRARALHAVVAELDLTVTNTWMDASSEQEPHTRSSLTEPGGAQTKMDFIMVSRKLEAKQVQVMEFDWFKTDHRAVLAVLSPTSRLRHSAKLGVNLRGWKPNGTWQKAASETLTDWKNWDPLAPCFWRQQRRTK